MRSQGTRKRNGGKVRATRDRRTDHRRPLRASPVIVPGIGPKEVVQHGLAFLLLDWSEQRDDQPSGERHAPEGRREKGHQRLIGTGVA